MLSEDYSLLCGCHSSSEVGSVPQLLSRRPHIQFYSAVRGKQDWNIPSGKWTAARFLFSPGTSHQDVWLWYATCHVVFMPTKTTVSGASFRGCLIVGVLVTGLIIPYKVTGVKTCSVPIASVPTLGVTLISPGFTFVCVCVTCPSHLEHDSIFIEGILRLSLSCSLY